MTNNITRDNASLSQTKVVYQFKCNKEECPLLPGSTYIGNTVDTLHHRLQNHKYKGPPEQHTEERHTEPLTQKQLRESTAILCSTRDRRRLGALEEAYIRHRNPDINRQYKFKVYLSLLRAEHEVRSEFFCGLRDKSQYTRRDATRPDPTRPDPTRPGRGTCREEGVGDGLSIGNSTTADPIAFKFGVCLETSQLLLLHKSEVE